jgi:hypothetical protein
MNKLLLGIGVVFASALNCYGQDTPCNRQVYGTKKYIAKLPVYVCIPPGYIMDDYARVSDLNKDGQEDFLAIKYNRKDDDQTDGELTYWQFYYRIKPDTIYRLRDTFNNLVPPFIKDIALEYLASHPEADQLYQLYPVRVSNDLSFVLKSDTIRLSYKMDDTYGKTFVFVFSKTVKEWTLLSVEYFMGELSDYWWSDDNFYYPLRDKFKYIETVKPRVSVKLSDFDLTEAFKFRDNEIDHLLTYHLNKVKKQKNKTVLDVNFNTCDGLKLPTNWMY